MAERLIIGVDFGTTYTGCGFVLSSKPASDIEVIKVWPNSDSISTEKVPSEFAYTTPVHNSLRENKAPYVKRDIRFGLELLPTEARLSCVKLLLDHKQQLPSFASVNDIWGLLWQANRSPVDAVADFLSKIREHVHSIVSDRYGNSLLQSIEVQYILTVPAMWSDAGKDQIIIAANRAGMGKNLRLISEPEAAAVHALKAIRAHTLEVDDNVIVCDAGGGTVDLITYRIAQKNPLGVEEVVVGTGGFCGSAFLNHGFNDLIRSKLEPHKFWQLQQKPKAWREATKRFDEYVKRQFSEQGGPSEYHIPMPGMPDDLHEAMEDGFLILQRNEIKSVFDPVINQVISLIEGQVAAVHAKDQMISAILLVGGFGQSRYLRERVAAHFATNHPPAYSVTTPVSGGFHGGDRGGFQARGQMITILQPVDAWSAIVRGAITRGLDGTVVTSRRVRYHYGTTMRETFNPHKHKKSQRVWDRLEEKYLANDCMDWFLQKGTAVSEQRKISLSYFITREEHEMEEDYDTQVYFSSCERAPSRFGPNVRSLCSLVTDMSKIPQSRWSGPFTNSFGTRYYKLSFEIDMKIDSASMSFDLVCRGTSYGTVSASFDHPEGA